MNDLRAPDWNNVIHLKRQDRPAVERETGKTPKRRRRRRWGGRLVSLGGLLFATPTTLLIVPYLFAMLRKRNDGVAASGVFEDLPNE